MTIGILPCAGRAERFGGLPKYLLPCPSGYLLERHVNAMHEARADQIFIGSSPDNIDILSKRFPNETYWASNYETMTQTVLSMKRPLNEDHNVIFGMPDTYLHTPNNPYATLANMLSASPKIDLFVGCWQVRHKQWREGGMVIFEQGDCIQDVIDKPESYPEHSYIWGVMAWRPSFWQCLEPDMPHVGYGIMPAMKKGLIGQVVVFEGDYYDCGTFERYATMIREVTA